MDQKIILCSWVLLHRDNSYCFAKGKTGVNLNTYNAPGGKVEEGETIEENACKECLEEIGVQVRLENLKKIGVVTFYHPERPEGVAGLGRSGSKTIEMHCYLVDIFEGEPRETEYMFQPEWFTFEAVPWDQFPYERQREWIEPMVMSEEPQRAELYYDLDKKVTHLSVEPL